MACGACARPRSISSARIPHPSTPAGTRTRTLRLCSAIIRSTFAPAPRLTQDHWLRLPRYLLKLKIQRPWPPAADRDDDDQHGDRDQAKHALGTRILEEKGDDEAREDGADPA